MGLLDDLKTFVVALALGVALTLSINYVVVNYTEGPAPRKVQTSQVAPAQQQPTADSSYQAPTAAPKYDAGSYGSSY